ncbi:MAG: hypothetical protein VKK62_01465 [Synechococcaceae cyanobacterium]|nr:hypothetical protein [Synechococcaceae cyanobacterium]
MLTSVAGISCASPGAVNAMTVKATLWTTLNGAIGGMSTGDIVKWEFDIVDAAPNTVNTLSANAWQGLGVPGNSSLRNLTGTWYNSSLTAQLGAFSGTYNNDANLNQFRVSGGAGSPPAIVDFTSASTSLWRFVFTDSTGNTGLAFPNSVGLNVLSFGTVVGNYISLNKANPPSTWNPVNPPTVSNLAAQAIVDNGFENANYSIPGPNTMGNIGDATETSVTLNVNSIRLSVPGPLPALGLASAFAFSRKLRFRIKASRS